LFENKPKIQLGGFSNDTRGLLMWFSQGKDVLLKKANKKTLRKWESAGKVGQAEKLPFSLFYLTPINGIRPA